MPKKFWIVWSNGYEGAIRRWPTKERALKCAKEVARRFPGRKIYILEALTYSWIPEPQVETVAVDFAENEGT